MSQQEECKQRRIVVVGVDGSPGAREALRWAVAEARLRQTRLRVVHAWTARFAGVPGGGYGYLDGTPELLAGDGVSDMRWAAEEMLEGMMREIAADADGVEVERQVVEGAAADVLIRAAAEGDLLVVGSRGHGGLAGLLLGSISQQCAYHAPCPVVIVRALMAPAVTDAEPTAAA